MSGTTSNQEAIDACISSSTESMKSKWKKTGIAYAIFYVCIVVLIGATTILLSKMDEESFVGLSFLRYFLPIVIVTYTLSCIGSLSDALQNSWKDKEDGKCEEDPSWSREKTLVYKIYSACLCVPVLISLFLLPMLVAYVYWLNYHWTGDDKNEQFLNYCYLTVFISAFSACATITPFLYAAGASEDDIYKQ